MCPQAPLPLSVSVGQQLVFKKHQHVEQSSPFSLLLTSGVVRYSTEVFGSRLLTTQEGEMAFSAFVGIVALLATLQTRGRQK